MLVGEVKPLRVAGSRSPAMLSAGRPVAGSVIASKDVQVSAAYASRTRLSGSWWCRSVLGRRRGRPTGTAAGGDGEGECGRDGREDGCSTCAHEDLLREARVGGIYLMPVMAMPCMMWRCSTRKTASTGITTTTEPASSRPYFVAFWPTA